MLKKLTPVLFIVVCGAFIYGLSQLFVLRFRSGDVYPAYSSLRVDPLGAKAFYESLENLRDTRRNFAPLSRFTGGRGTTLFHIGIDPTGDSPEQEIKDVEMLALAGTRLVFTFAPVLKAPGKQEKADEAKPEEDEPDQKPKTLGTNELANRWGLSLGYLDVPKSKRAFVAQTREPGLEPSISWHSLLCFEKLDKSLWRVIYRCENRPVIVERGFGSGSIVLCADSYFVSNEALRRERHPQLLAWLAGTGAQVVFDETHLGISENPGIAALARKYNLHALVGCLAVLAALFAWKNASSFVPPYEESDATGDVVAGKDSAAGFVNLLRRSIPASGLLRVCFDEWRKSFAHRADDLKEKLTRAEAVIAAEEALPARQRSAVKSYRAISEILAEKK